MGTDHEGDPTDAPAPPRAFRPRTPPRPPPVPDVVVRERLGQLLPGCHVLRVLSLDDRPALAQAWQAHREAALDDGDVAVLCTAAALLEAADRVPPGRLLAAQVAWKGRGYAAWIDAQREAVRGVLHEPASWL